MTSPRCRLNGARESRPAGPINLQENPSTTSAIRQTRLLRGRRNLQCVRGLGVFHGRLNTSIMLHLGSALRAYYGGRSSPPVPHDVLNAAVPVDRQPTALSACDPRE